MAPAPQQRSDRFEHRPGEPTMRAVVTRAPGGFEVLDPCDVPIPRPGAGEVLVHVLAAGVNNTEINTRLGWYSAAVDGGTGDLGADERARAEAGAAGDGGWDRQTPFPFVQGTDCCGRIVAVGPDVAASRIGERILVRACMRTAGWDRLETVWMASDFDGAFAQLVVVPDGEAFAVDADWTDAELGTIPCAYGTSENMLHRADVGPGDHVLVTGASGGVGSATVQLARRRGARVTAIAGADKASAVVAVGADRVVPRGEDVVAAVGEESVDVVVDNVAGDGFGDLLRVLRRGGRYATSGAIAGPVVTMDVRTLYLKDLTLVGCTAWDEPVFGDLVGYVERDEIRPLLAATFPLEEIVEAQRTFLAKEHVGKLVLVPPPLDDAQRAFVASLSAS